MAPRDRRCGERYLARSALGFSYSWSCSCSVFLQVSLQFIVRVSKESFQIGRFHPGSLRGSYLPCPLVGVRQMNVIHAIPDELVSAPEPGVICLVPLRFLAPVLRPLDVRRLAQNAGRDERADIHSDTFVQVRVPADGLL